jgi:hypothetical protein
MSTPWIEPSILEPASIPSSSPLGPVYPKDSVVPYVLASIIGITFVISLRWIYISFLDWRALHSRWNSPLTLQMIGWTLFSFDLFLMTLGLATYMQCQHPYLEILSSAPEPWCWTHPFFRVCKFLRLYSSAMLVVSVMVRFQPMYKAFASTKILVVHRWVIALIALNTVICTVIIGLRTPNRILNGYKHKPQDCIWDSLEFPLYAYHMVVLMISCLVSAWYGIYFIMARIERLQACGQQLSLHEPVELHRFYICLLCTALLASLYISLHVVWHEYPTMVPYLVRTTTTTVVLKSFLVGSMQSLEAISLVLSRSCRSLCVNVEKAPPLSTKAPPVKDVENALPATTPSKPGRIRFPLSWGN